MLTVKSLVIGTSLWLADRRDVPWVTLSQEMKLVLNLEQINIQCHGHAISGSFSRSQSEAAGVLCNQLSILARECEQINAFVADMTPLNREFF